MAEEMNNTPAPKKNRKKGGIIAAVIVVVIVIAGIGFWCWHETPAFCGTMCHDTMGEHLANYEGTDDSKGAGLAHLHSKLKDAVTCLDCHEADLNAQVSEAKMQLSGSYDKDKLGLAAGYYVDNEKCLSCHGGSWKALAEKTASLEPYNPHDSIHGTAPYCNECHKGHAKQVDICGECHPNGGQKMYG